MVAIELEGDWYEGELPHVALGPDFAHPFGAGDRQLAPPLPLELGLDGLEYEVVIGPVELARRDDATLTRRETIHLAFLFGPSARVVGQAAP